MKKKTLTHAALVMQAALALGMSAGTASAQIIYDPPIPTELLVRLTPGSDVDAFLLAMRDLAGSDEVHLGGGVASRDIYLLEWPTNLSEPYINDNIVVRPDVVWGEMNYTSETAEGRIRDYFNAQTFNPDDYQDQPAWGQLGLGQGQQFATGRGVVVAVLDTGVDATHPALAGRVLPGWNYVADSADTSDTGDGLDNDGDGDIDEMTGHGTFIAGLIARVAPEAQILPYTVLNSDGKSDLFDVVEGWFEAIDSGATVINISLGSTYKCELWEDALDECAAAGIIVVAAAGNQNTNDLAFVEYPAMLRDALAVGSVDEVDVKTAESNFSICRFGEPDCDERDQLALVAPGGDIHSSLPGGFYAAMNGTSASTAIVSGTVAMILEQHPEWPMNVTRLDFVKATLQGSAVNVDAQNPDHVGLLGAGRLDIAAAIDDTFPGDFDLDGDVDQADLGTLLSCFGMSACGDLDGDADTDQGDLGILLSYFGSGT